jgi:uncharacterized protein
MEKSIVLNKIKSAILQVDQNATIILYGSRARGDFRKDSDWDFLILTDLPETKNTKDQFRDIIFETELDLEEPVSTIIHNRNVWMDYEIMPLHILIDKEGVVI